MEAFLTRLLANQAQLRSALKFLFISLVLIGFVAALVPMHGVEINNFDKVMHAGAMFGFAFLLDVATTRSFWRWKVPVLLGYGGLIEILQLLTPWRSFSIADFLADTTGVLLYWLLWRLVLRRYIEHENG